MGKFTSLLFVVAIGGLGQAVPLLEDFVPTAVGLLERAAPPIYKEVEISPGSAESYHFYSGKDWADDTTVKKLANAKAVLSKMNTEGLFTALVMRGAKTYCVGSSTGKTDLPDFVIKENSANDAQNCIYTNGGFFITGKDKYLRAEHDGPVIADSSSLIYFSVGATSVTDNTVSVPKVHKDQYATLVGEDGSFLECGPNLKQPVSADATSLQYWAKDGKGNKITNPVWKQTQAAQEAQDKKKTGRVVTWCEESKGWQVVEQIRNQNGAVGAEATLRTVFAHIPGGVATANEPNERLVTVMMADDLKIVFAYTSKRENGVTINSMRDVINVFLDQYLNSNLSKAKTAINLDGGASIFVGWMKEGALSILAAGGLEGQQSEVPHDANKIKKFRDVTTMVKYTLKEPATDAKGSKKDV